MRYLILGCGPAGIAAAKSIRKAKPDAEIVIATEEYEAPYMRPLLPDLILGDAD
jgi:NADPH-dependent 2,4-dienoyl-CoA reductase/sulfur reductase-like enzyme